MELETVVNRNLLRYAVGHTLFCKTCEALLDVSRATHLEFAKGDSKGTMTVCATCGDNWRAKLSQAGYTVTVFDGRVLFPVVAVAPRERKPKVKYDPLVRGTVYQVKHSTGFIRARFDGERISYGHTYGFHSTRDVKRFMFTNLKTGRQIEIKSRAKITAIAV